ncbi:MAG: DUF488 domain-containing protein [Reyranellaceae bacterium]
MAHAAREAVYTVGHSTRPIAAFVELLAGCGIAALADIRTVPRSRYNPQYNAEALAPALAAAGIAYAAMPGLGGLRKPRAESPNGGWRNDGFRGYADYMQTAAFETAIEALVARAARERVAIMCAEAVPWRCHRSLVGDALLVRGVQVIDILSPGEQRPHTLTPFAVVHGTALTYPPEQGSLL